MGCGKAKDNKYGKAVTKDKKQAHLKLPGKVSDKQKISEVAPVSDLRDISKEHKNPELHKAEIYSKREEKELSLLDKQKARKNISEAVAYQHMEPEMEVKEEAPKLKQKTLYFRKEYGRRNL